MARGKRTKKQLNGRSVKPRTSLPPIKSKGVSRKSHRVSQKGASNGISPAKWIVEELEAEKFVLNPYLCSNISKFSSIWRKGKSFNDEVVDLQPSPFKHCVIKKLLNDNSHLDNACKELLGLPYQQMLNDLYSCHQSSLSENYDSLPTLDSIVKFIKRPLRTLVQKITGRNFSDKMTITASQYKFTDRLLCHDDNLHDRSVAFIFYLCKDWNEKLGGSLDLFECDSEKQPKNVVKSIFPSFGSFAFFEVTDSSYHQVSEIIGPKSMRLSINGWYHGEDLPQQIPWHGPLPKMLAPINPRGCSLHNFLCSTWLDPKIHAKVKSSFEKELSISLPKFLESSTFEQIEAALRHDSIVWETCGPANHRKYQVAEVTNLPAVVSQFLKLLQSKQWFRFLSQCTVEIDPDVKPTPKCWFEVQRWQAGDYTVLQDHDPHTEATGIDIHLYFGVDKQRKNQQGGEVFYLGPDRDEHGNLEQAFHLEPDNNTATIVAHIEGMAVLTKYLDHRNKHFFKICARYSQSFD